MHDRKAALREGVVAVEGVRLCEEALKSGLKPKIIIYTRNRKTLASEWSERFMLPDKTEFLAVSDDVMESIASTVNPQGIAAIIEAPDPGTEVPYSNNALYLIADGVSDPGNLGTMIRTADAFDFTAVILSKETVDPFNEKAIRASMGSCFHVPVIQGGTIGEICLIIKQMGVQLIASHLSGKALESARFKFPAALVIGNEARGVGEDCVSQCDMMVKIMMPGAAESLNAASACAILSYVLSGSRTED
ncbi:MAG: RNA methyltransferase [Oscillospiraceae bacterium]|nr:RNA methyltransferase [Oscillospiraceae bacterium]